MNTIYHISSGNKSTDSSSPRRTGSSPNMFERGSPSLGRATEPHLDDRLPQSGSFETMERHPSERKTSSNANRGSAARPSRAHLPDSEANPLSPSLICNPVLCQKLGCIAKVFERMISEAHCSRSRSCGYHSTGNTEIQTSSKPCVTVNNTWRRRPPIIR